MLRPGRYIFVGGVPVSVEEQEQILLQVAMRRAEQDRAELEIERIAMLRRAELVRRAEQERRAELARQAELAEQKAALARYAGVRRDVRHVAAEVKERADVKVVRHMPDGERRVEYHGWTRDVQRHERATSTSVHRHEVHHVEAAAPSTGLYGLQMRGADRPGSRIGR